MLFFLLKKPIPARPSPKISKLVGSGMVAAAVPSNLTSEIENALQLLRIQRGITIRTIRQGAGCTINPKNQGSIAVRRLFPLYCLCSAVQRYQYPRMKVTPNERAGSGSCGNNREDIKTYMQSPLKV